MSNIDNKTFKACFCTGACQISGHCGLPSLTDTMNPTFEIPAKELGIYRNFGEKLRHLSETADERFKQTMREAAVKTFENLKSKLIAVASNGATSYHLVDYELSHDAQEYFDALEEILKGEGLILVHYGDHDLGVRWDIPEG